MASAYTKIWPNLIIINNHVQLFSGNELRELGVFATYFDDTVHECQLRMRTTQPLSAITSNNFIVHNTSWPVSQARMSPM